MRKGRLCMGEIGFSIVELLFAKYSHLKSGMKMKDL
jgi:hypothetical protein